MKKILIFIVVLILACQYRQQDYSITILENGVVDSTFIQKIDMPGRMLLGWYLFAYGNECTGDTEKPKSQLMMLLGVDNECDKAYVDALRSWFSKDVYHHLKLQTCPCLPAKGAIQNEFKYLALNRHLDTMSISFRVDGMNNSQEKSWNVERQEHFLLVDGTFLFLNTE